MCLFLVNIVLYIGKHSIFRCLPNVQVYDASCWICNHLSIGLIPSQHICLDLFIKLTHDSYACQINCCYRGKVLLDWGWTHLSDSLQSLFIYVVWVSSCSFPFSTSQHCCYLLIFLHICCLKTWSNIFPHLSFCLNVPCILQLSPNFTFPTCSQITFSNHLWNFTHT
jgi:hypothetical protein